MSGLILEELRAAHGERTIAEIATLMNSHGHPASPADVSRALSDLVSEGQVVARGSGPRRRYVLRLDLREPPTAHLICRHCGRLGRVPVDVSGRTELERMARSCPDGWTMEGISVSLVGSCPSCASKSPPSL